jgi:choline dehydrogenase-like flavoprotein
VLPLFKQSENHFAGDSAFHSGAGEWRVERQRLSWPILDAFRSAAEQSGIASIDDFNQGDNEGCGYFQVNQKAGVRWNAAKAFLADPPAPNLTVLTGVEVDRVLLDNGRAAAVVARWQARQELQGAQGNHPVRRFRRLAEHPAALRIGPRPAAATAGHRRRARTGRRRRQPAGPPATAPDLQTGKRPHPEPDRRQPVGQDGHGPALPV